MIHKIKNRTLLDWVIKRVKKSKRIDEVIIVTSNLKQDKKIIDIAKKNKVNYFCGSHTNVLKRFVDASTKFKCENIIRVCADNIFISHKFLDEIINKYKEGNYDYICNHLSKNYSNQVDGFGAEIFPFSILKNIIKNTKNSEHLEHVTKYIWDNKKLFKILSINSKFQLKYPELKFEINSTKDYERIKSIVDQTSINYNDDPIQIVKKTLNYEFQNTLENLFYLKRSITGKDTEKTLSYINKSISIEIKKNKSNKKIFDWRIPKVWDVVDAYISDQNNKKIIDYNINPLHLVNYSTSIDKQIKWNDLKKNIFKHTKIKAAIPYRTSYYNKNWGFCVTHKQYEILSKVKGPLKVFIKSSFKNGYLNYGEKIIKGKSKKEILISSYICHPHMANDSLSGVILAMYLARNLSNLKNLKYTYRFVFVPETIGALTFLKNNFKNNKNIFCGLNVTTVGGTGLFGYKKTWNEHHILNSLIEDTFSEKKLKYLRYKFDINGSDERQYSSPGFRINIATISKDKYYEYPYYHTSLDDLNYVKGSNIFKSFLIYRSLINKIENLTFYKNNVLYGEPMLSKRNLYPKLGGHILPKNIKNTNLLLWILFYSDGLTSTYEISKKTKYNQKEIEKISENLKKLKLLSINE